MTDIDRGHLLTEQRNPASGEIDALPVIEALRVMCGEDARVVDVVRAAIPQVAALVELVSTRMRAGGRLIYFGAGTSGRLGVLDASECPPTFFTEPGQVVGIIAGGDRALRVSSEGLEDDPHGARADLDALGVGSQDVVVGIAAGGTTAYVQGGLVLAKQRGAATALLCCVQADRPEAVDTLVTLPVGPEVVTGSTRMKAGTATKMVLNMISTVTMIQLGKTWGNLMVDLRPTNAKLRDRAIRILLDQCDLSRSESTALLDEAGGRVKVALVMARLKLDAKAAQEQLERHQGRLRPLLGPPH